MKIIISPAKKMNVDTDTFPVGGLHHFLEDAAHLMGYIKSLSYGEARKLWNCSDSIAELNYERFRGMELKKRLTGNSRRTVGF